MTVGVDRLEKLIRGRVLTDEPLSKYTSLRIGGPADLMAFPADVEDLRALLAYAREEGMPTFVLGGGSNSLVRDGGFRGLVIHMGESFKDLAVLPGEGSAGDGTRAVRVGAGVRVSRLLAFCSRLGLAGLECLTGVPGTVGGAIRGNAGAYGGGTWDHLREVELVLASGEEAVLPRDAISYGYRRVDLPPGSVVIAGVFVLRLGEPAEIRRTISQRLVQRNAAQPVEARSAGCMFKNPPGDYAGRLVDVAGLKGTRVGDAQVSPKHGNFIVNLGRARAADVLALLERARARVRAATGVTLELEVQIVGEP